MPRGRPRKNPSEVLIKSAELIGWALGGIEREIVETKQRLTALTAQANQLRVRMGRKGAAAVSTAVTAASGTIEAGPAGRKRRRKMSAEARRKISERMKKTWAERRKNAK